mmetsp:Transcript_8678/g.19474  ORF Transcript_8678/g.19474 Transcript_8678/m.19474 type:complete len:303 (+) Transcript_8678:996-1904(+)
MLKTKNRKLRQNGVTNSQLGLRIGKPQLFQRSRHAQNSCQRVQWSVFLFRILILYHGMAMTERTTLNILSSEPNVIALKQKRAKRHCLCQSPINLRALLSHCLPSFEDLIHLTVNLEPLGYLTRFVSNVTKSINVHSSGTNTTVLPRRFEPGPFGTQPILRLRFVSLTRLVVSLVALECEGTNLFHLLLGHGSLLNQLLLEDLQRGWMPRDGLVQLRLSEHGLIQLVVSVTTVANHINDDISSPFVTPLNRRLKSTRHGYWIVSVAVEDRAVECLSKVRGVGSRPTVDGVGSESNLIVYNDV